MLQTTIAGSLPKPAWLAEPEKPWAPWRLERDELWRGREDAGLVWLKEHEDAGCTIVVIGARNFISSKFRNSGGNQCNSR